MKSLLPVCKRVKPFLAENKELVAGITLVNLIFFLLTFTNLFIFKLLFILVFSYSNFRVLKLYTHEAPTKHFLATQVKFFVLTVVEAIILCVGAHWALDLFLAASLPLLASIVLGVVVSIITVYILLLAQALFAVLFVNPTSNYNPLKVCDALSTANKALSVYGNQHRSHMISLFTFFFTVLLLLGLAGADSKLYSVIIFAFASFCVSIYNVCVLPLVQDLNDEATTKANREELAKVLAGECGCDGHKESDCHSTFVTVAGRIINPEFYLCFIGKALYFLLYSIPGAFQYVYALIDDIIAGHHACSAERAAKKAAQATKADDKAETKDEAKAETKADEDSLEKAFNTPAVIPEGDPDNKSDTIAEDFKIKGDAEANAAAQAAAKEADNSDSLETAFNTPAVIPEGEPDNKTDSLAEDFQSEGDAPVKVTEDTEVDTNPDTLESSFEAPLSPATDEEPANKTDTLAEEFQTVTEEQAEAEAQTQAEELATEEADQAKAEVESVEEEIDEATTSIETTVYPFPDYSEEKAEEKAEDKEKKDKADK